MIFSCLSSVLIIIAVVCLFGLTPERVTDDLMQLITPNDTMPVSYTHLNFNGECTEVGMYLAMARVAHREGYPEIGMYWEKAAFEEAEHAAKFAELLGEVVTDSTKKNLEMRADDENGATKGKFELAKLAKELNLDAIHDTVQELSLIHI